MDEGAEDPGPEAAGEEPAPTAFPVSRRAAVSGPSWLTRSARSVAFGSPLYNLLLGRGAPAGLVVVPPDPWPGNAARGAAMSRGHYAFAGEVLDANAAPWRERRAGPGWRSALQGFEWLRDLRALGGDAARRHARLMVASWLDHHPGWTEGAWQAEMLGNRIASWIGLHDFFCSSADDEFRTRVFESLARQVRHLTRVAAGGEDGAGLLAAARGLIYGGVAVPGGGKALNRGLDLIDREIPRQILPDGGHAERNPAAHLRVLRLLIDIRGALRAARQEVPEPLQHAIERMAPALRFFRHGDGGLALFNGTGADARGDAAEADTATIDAALAQADIRGRPLKSAPHCGYERLLAGRGLVVMDCGAPPPPGLDSHAHAGTLAFEFSVGRDRLIVNCGAHPAGRGPGRRALAATAAHSTLTVADTNSAEVLDHGGLGRRPARILCERYDADGAMLVEASHDGYVPAFGLTHRRRLYLADQGEALRGEDTLDGPAGHGFALRFHLHPRVRAEQVEPDSAILTLPGGQVWYLRTGSDGLALSESIYLGRGTEPEPTLQVVIEGVTRAERTLIKWGLTRDRPAGTQG